MREDDSIKGSDGVVRAGEEQRLAEGFKKKNGPGTPQRHRENWKSSMLAVPPEASSIKASLFSLNRLTSLFPGETAAWVGAEGRPQQGQVFPYKPRSCP